MSPARTKTFSARTVTRPPLGIASRALSTRLLKTRSICPWSISTERRSGAVVTSLRTLKPLSESGTILCRSAARSVGWRTEASPRANVINCWVSVLAERAAFLAAVRKRNRLVVGAQIAHRHVDVEHEHREEVVEVVGNAAGQNAGRFEFAERELPVGGLFFRGQIVHGGDPGGPTVKRSGLAGDLDGDLRAVLTQANSFVRRGPILIHGDLVDRLTFGVGEVGQRFADQFGLGITERGCEGGIRHDDHSLLVDDPALESPSRARRWNRSSLSLSALAWRETRASMWRCHQMIRVIAKTPRMMAVE